MGFKTLYQGILFVEGKLDIELVGKPLDLTLKSFSAQLKNLNDVKSEMAFQAKREGYNTIVDFTYGQKQRLFRFDDVVFWGKGLMVSLPQEELNQLLEKIKV